MRDTIESVSPIEQLARMCDLSERWTEVNLVMLTCFDVSGTEHGEFCLAMGGFVSSAKDWTEFSRLWNERLAQDGLTWFHMVDFAHSDNEFRHGWKDNEPRRKALLGDLMRLIKTWAYRKFGCMVVNKTFASNFSQEMKDEYHLNAYSLCGRDCAAKVSNWGRMERVASPIELVFAEGDIGKGKLIKRLNDDGYATPSFRFPKDTMTKAGMVKGFIPLQAADFLAYEMFLGEKLDYGADENKWRWGFREFSTMQGEPGIYVDKDLQELDKNLELLDAHYDWWMSLVAKQKKA